MAPFLYTGMNLREHPTFFERRPDISYVCQFGIVILDSILAHVDSD